MADEPKDVQAELVAWIEAHPELQGEGSAIDVALRLLDHAYHPDGTDEPSLLTPHTPVLKRVVAGGKSRRVTYTARLPMSIEVTEQWADDVPLAEIEADVQRRADDVVRQVQTLLVHAKDPENTPRPVITATVRFGRPEQVGVALLEDGRR